jgi:hypothetical protein
MKIKQLAVSGLLFLAILTSGQAFSQVVVQARFGNPYRPRYYRPLPPRYYYRPAPVFVAPPPVYAPVFVPGYYVYHRHGRRWIPGYWR